MIYEQAWALQAQQGDEEAFTRLVEYFQVPVFNLCYRMLGEPEAAEDAAQESFLRAFQNLWRYNSDRSFATWLLSIAAHYCIDLLRRKHLAVFSMDEIPDFEMPDRSAPDPENETVRREESKHLQLVLRDLDPLDRAAIILRYWNDCSEKEIAEILALTVSAVKSRLHRARRELAENWQEKQPKGCKGRMTYESQAL